MEGEEGALDGGKLGRLTNRSIAPHLTSRLGIYEYEIIL